MTAASSTSSAPTSMPAVRAVSCCGRRGSRSRAVRLPAPARGRSCPFGRPAPVAEPSRRCSAAGTGLRARGSCAGSGCGCGPPTPPWCRPCPSSTSRSRPGPRPRAGGGNRPRGTDHQDMRTVVTRHSTVRGADGRPMPVRRTKAGRALAAHEPGRSGGDLRRLGDGLDHSAFLVGDLVVRVADVLPW